MLRLLVSGGIFFRKMAVFWGEGRRGHSGDIRLRDLPQDTTHLVCRRFGGF